MLGLAAAPEMVMAVANEMPLRAPYVANGPGSEACQAGQEFHHEPLQKQVPHDGYRLRPGIGAEKSGPGDDVVAILPQAAEGLCLGAERLVSSSRLKCARSSPRRSSATSVFARSVSVSPLKRSTS